MVKYQDRERVVMINNIYVPVKPTEWKDRFNISIVVGLGTGSKEQQTVMLNSILERQIQAFQLQGGKEFPMVNLKNIYNTLSKVIENAGLKNVESYFVDPEVGKQGDKGIPIVESNPDNDVSKIYLELASKVKSIYLLN